MWKRGGRGKEMVTTTTRGEGCCNKGGRSRTEKRREEVGRL